MSFLMIDGKSNTNAMPEKLESWKVVKLQSRKVGKLQSCKVTKLQSREVEIRPIA